MSNPYLYSFIMISEETIDRCIETIAEGSTDWLEVMSKQQPVLAGFLTAEDHEAFTEEETQYLYYLAVLCWMCFDITYEEMDELNEEDLSIREEQNWNRIDSMRPSSLQKIVDKLMPDYVEQELLFYLEDALQIDAEDPEHPVTKSGQIPLFITLITLVDVLTEAAKD